MKKKKKTANDYTCDHLSTYGCACDEVIMRLLNWILLMAVGFR